jgi:hypothetical protein
MPPPAAPCLVDTVGDKRKRATRHRGTAGDSNVGGVGKACGAGESDITAGGNFARAECAKVPL